jgi:hypothetical protein
VDPKKNLTPIMSLVYPERKCIKERKHDAGKPKLNRIKQMAILARSITNRKPNTRRSGQEENAQQHKIRKTQGGFSSIK